MAVTENGSHTENGSKKLHHKDAILHHKDAINLEAKDDKLFVTPFKSVFIRNQKSTTPETIQINQKKNTCFNSGNTLKIFKS